MLTILLGLSSSLFFAAAYHSASEEHSRNALATGVLGAMILGGSFFIAAIVFQRPPPTAIELPEETERSRNEVLGARGRTFFPSTSHHVFPLARCVLPILPT